MSVEAYKRALAIAESGNDPTARGVSAGMRAPAAGKYQLTASTAEGLMGKYGKQYPSLAGMQGPQILDRVAGDAQLQERLQDTLFQDQRQTITNLGGNPDDLQAHTLLHRFGTKATKEHIQGTLKGGQARGEDIAFGESPDQYLAKVGAAGGFTPQLAPSLGVGAGIGGSMPLGDVKAQAQEATGDAEMPQDFGPTPWDIAEQEGQQVWQAAEEAAYQQERKNAGRAYSPGQDKRMRRAAAEVGRSAFRDHMLGAGFGQEGGVYSRGEAPLHGDQARLGSSREHWQSPDYIRRPNAEGTATEWTRGTGQSPWAQPEAPAGHVPARTGLDDALRVGWKPWHLAGLGNQGDTSADIPRSLSEHEPYWDQNQGRGPVPGAAAPAGAAPATERHATGDTLRGELEAAAAPAGPAAAPTAAPRTSGPGASPSDVIYGPEEGPPDPNVPFRQGGEQPLPPQVKAIEYKIAKGVAEGLFTPEQAAEMKASLFKQWKQQGGSPSDQALRDRQRGVQNLFGSFAAGWGVGPDANTLGRDLHAHSQQQRARMESGWAAKDKKAGEYMDDTRDLLMKDLKYRESQEDSGTYTYGGQAVPNAVGQSLMTSRFKDEMDPSWRALREANAELRKAQAEAARTKATGGGTKSGKAGSGGTDATSRRAVFKALGDMKDAVWAGLQNEETRDAWIQRIRRTGIGFPEGTNPSEEQVKTFVESLVLGDWDTSGEAGGGDDPFKGHGA